MSVVPAAEHSLAPLTALAQDVAVLKRDYSGLHADVAALGNKFDHLATSFSAKMDAFAAAQSAAQKTNWPIILGGLGLAATLAATIIGGGWAMIEMRSRLTVAESVNPIAVANADSLRDRNELRERLSAHDRIFSDRATTIGQFTSDIAALRSGLGNIEDRVEMLAANQQTISRLASDNEQKIAEMETQDCAISSQSEMRADSIEDKLALLWAEVKKQVMPPGHPVPRTGRCN